MVFTTIFPPAAVNARTSWSIETSDAARSILATRGWLVLSSAPSCFCDRCRASRCRRIASASSTRVSSNWRSSSLIPRKSAASPTFYPASSIAFRFVASIGRPFCCNNRRGIPAPCRRSAVSGGVLIQPCNQTKGLGTGSLCSARCAFAIPNLFHWSYQRYTGYDISSMRRLMSFATK